MVRYNPNHAIKWTLSQLVTVLKGYELQLQSCFKLPSLYSYHLVDTHLQFLHVESGGKVSIEPDDTSCLLVCTVERKIQSVTQVWFSIDDGVLSL